VAISESESHRSRALAPTSGDPRRPNRGRNVTSQDLTLVAGHAFIVTDVLGDVTKRDDRGLFVADMRFLRRYEFRLAGTTPVLLGAGLVGNSTAHIYATNIAVGEIPPHTLELTRRQRLGRRFVDRIRIANRGLDVVDLEVTLAIDADFADIFEVRAPASARPPRRSAGRAVEGRLVFSAHGEGQRHTLVQFSPLPVAIRRGVARFPVKLHHNENWNLQVSVGWVVPKATTLLPVPVYLPSLQKQQNDWPPDVPILQTSDLDLLHAYRQSIQDLLRLEFSLSSGDTIPAAGVPWYLAIFGRDALITSLQTLILGPRLAAGTLRTLAAYQAVRGNAFRDAEPGKMPHEIRFGSLAENDAVPHARYYGTVDATPLWLMLLRAVYEWTGDRALVDKLLPTAKRALHWIDEFGDLDGDGLIEYRKRSHQGLDNQGWKDSWDGIRFADGTLAKPPIALVEVQGYVYAAKRAMAELYQLCGRNDEATSLMAEANRLKQMVHDAFWLPGEGCYALALDGRKRQVDSVASNQGHLLWTGLPEQHHARSVVDRLMAPDCFSGWGIRTMAASMTGYNPLGYHNGSVWPHDTALVAAGFRRYGFEREAAAVADGLLAASRQFADHRLPELFCGYSRSEAPFPVSYPGSCSPQAWSAGALIMIVTELAGIEVVREGIRVSETAHGRDLRLFGVPFRGGKCDLEARTGSGR
jgi:glycogen debranching enzyme